jgi:integrase
MIGARPLTDQEVKLILSNVKTERNRCLITLGIRAGYRISELLSIQVSDCVQYGKIKDFITVNRSNMKGKHSSRTVVLHEEAKKALIEMGILSMQPNQKLFPITRQQAHKILKAAVNKGEIEGKVSTHSLRKSFCKKVYHALKKDLVATQKAMGHKSINSTVSYLSFEQSEIDQAIKGI